MRLIAKAHEMRYCVYNRKRRMQKRYLLFIDFAQAFDIVNQLSDINSEITDKRNACKICKFDNKIVQLKLYKHRLIKYNYC